MYFTGTIAASGATLVNFQTDIIGILTGSITSAAGLSSTFAAGSTFINTVAPGWTLHDSAAGTAANGVTPKVIRAPWSDNGSNYKNVHISSSTASILGFNGYETWNNTTHVGTNPITAALANFQLFSLTANTIIIISASANHIFISAQTSDTTGASAIVLFSEFSRDDPWNVVANGYPAWIQSGTFTTVGFNNSGFCRLYNPATVADNVTIIGSTPGSYPGCVLVPNGFFSGGSALLTTGGGGGGLTAHNPNISALSTIIGADSNKAAAKYLFEIAVRVATGGTFYTTAPWLGGSLSNKNSSIYYAANNLGSIGDEFVVGSSTYKLLASNATGFTASRIAIKKA